MLFTRSFAVVLTLALLIAGCSGPSSPRSELQR